MSADFLRAAPTLQLLLSRYRILNKLMPLEPHQAVAVIPGREAFMLFPFVLKNAPE
jgi:hypothetical protein